MWSIHDCLLRTTRTPFESKIAKLSLKWGKDLQNTKEAFICWMLPILARIHKAPKPASIDRTFEEPHPSEPITFPEYVFDMHVTGVKDYVRFAVEGSHVENEDSTRVNAEWKALYIKLKFDQASKGKGVKKNKMMMKKKGGNSAVKTGKQKRKATAWTATPQQSVPSSKKLKEKTSTTTLQPPKLQPT